MKNTASYFMSVIVFLLMTSCGPNDTKWQSIGPFSGTGIGDFLPCAGRIDAMAFSENFNGEATSAMYIAGPGMGIWRSTDFLSDNPCWVPLTDHITHYANPLFTGPAYDLDFRQDINNILSLAVDPTYPRRIYAGTASCHSVILRSEDGGNKWSVINRSAFDNHVGATKLFVDPTGHLYVAGAGGLWLQTTPAGNAFTNLATQGINPPMGNVEFHDAVYIAAGNERSAVIYVAIIDRNSATRDRSGIWSYSDGIWTQMDINMLNIQGLPFFKADINRIKMHYRQGVGVVAALASDNGALRDLQGSFLNVFKLHRQILGGSLSWEPQWSSPTLYINTQAHVNDLGTCIDHNGIIYSGGVGLYQSDGNGGVVHCKPAIADGKHNYHVDEHMVLEYKNMMYMATDGGLFRFPVPDNPQTGFHHFESLNSSSLRNFLTTSVDRDKIVGDHFTGNHDNGLVHVTCRQDCEFVSTSNEDEMFRFAPNRAREKNKAIAYSFVPSWGFYKSTDRGQSFINTNQPVTLGNGMYCFHQTTKGRMLLNVTIPKTVNGIIRDINTVYETRSDWTDTPKDILDQTLINDGPPTAMCYSGENILIAANRKIYLSTDDGMTWKMVWSSNAKIVDMFSDPSNLDEIYFATDLQWQAGSVFHATIVDAPALSLTNVTTLTGNLPGEVNHLALLTNGEGMAPDLYVTLNNTQTIWGLGGPGVYETQDLDGNNTNWTKVGKGLPDAKATDLQITSTGPGKGILMVALWGRGAWEIRR